jgi:hypothetical protein
MNPNETTTWVIDRLEGDVAVVEFDGTTFDLPLAVLPNGATEGRRLLITWAPPTGPKSKPKPQSIPDEIDL